MTRLLLLVISIQLVALAQAQAAGSTQPNSSLSFSQNQVIRSKYAPEWMVIMGRDQMMVGTMSYSNPRLHIKSMMLDFDDLDKPLQTAILDDMDNLPALLQSMRLELSDLKRKVRERYELGQVLAEACPSVRPDGVVTVTGVWAENADAVSAVHILDGKEKRAEKVIDRHSLPISICAFRHQGRDQYVLVTIRPKRAVRMQVQRVKVVVDKPLNECLAVDRKLAGKGFVALRFRVHQSGDQLKCSAIYWLQPQAKHSITVTNNWLLSEHDELMEQKGLEPGMSPKSFSYGRNQSVMLWSNAPMWPFPPAPQLLPEDRPIPFQYLPGMNLEYPTAMLTFLNNRVVTFMQRLNIPGLSLAVVKDELLKTAVAFGYSDVLKQTVMTPGDRIRIGSVSKTITATAVFLLMENGDLGLDERVFGLNGILGMDMTTNHTYPPHVTDITVRHLLTHTVGAWSNQNEDPVFKTEVRSVSALIREVVAKSPPAKPPGQEYAYSNMGYAILGKVIEYRSGLPYADFVNRRIFMPIGLGRQKTLSGVFRAPSEGNVLYYSTPESPDDPYELPHVSVLEACCGWVLSPSEVLKFMTHVDGFPLRRDLLRPDSFQLMGLPTRQSNYSYAFGWSVNERGFNGRSHQGQMPSSLNFLVRTDNGVEIMISTNKYPSRYTVDSEIAYLAHHIASLFEGPDLNGIDHFLDNSVV